ncbi:feruloyl-CoA synthetase [Defluviimonas sp. 20V17]|uniref:Feruloyl-CoA synthase n=1 Tax=Allgaiera indica TaxID=765699 RepID=A0AAN4UPT6_9RHOB|nr:feruloyl-CoA synthase [Allgaiera indica]KDB03992.1 feruloyl-CoA synthetase [Defluviimonas sp. 20V17]GHD99374.1 feruloyl-CoA synthase [Allgaiera indica]SDW27829.1 feruloyl-CoA synthase [Allgaiera indica]
MGASYPAHSVLREDRADGTVILRSGLALGEVVNDTNVWLRRWAEAAPDRVFLAERRGAGWREMRYAEMWQAARSVAQGLRDHGIGPGDAVVVLSGPSVDHGILMQACQMIGAPIVPLAEQYSTIPAAHPRLDYCVGKLRAAMVYAASAADFGKAMARPVFEGAVKVTSDAAAEGCVSFDTLRAATPGRAVDEAHARITPDTVAKILFTSGSTAHPKGVPNTQRMLCVNQAQYLACLPVLGERPHVLLDWLPWNHTFAGNANFNMMLSNGGSLYLDDGKPLPGRFARTLENAARLPLTLSFNVPVAYALLVEAMRENPMLRRNFFRDLDIFFYAGASLPADTWAAVEQMARAERDEVPLMMSSWGMTETAPSTLIVHEKGGRSGNVGVPVPGVAAKLIPAGTNRYQLRVTGPNLFAGYLDDAKKNAEAFDDEGFFISGDAVGMVDPDDVARGLFFDGRISEDFKLMTGTWVHAATLRLDLLPRLAGLVQDIVITGEGRREVGLLLFAPPGRWRDAGGGVVEDPALAARIRAVLSDLARTATGSSNRIARALVMAEPPNVGAGEITAKGSLNVRAILDRRKDLVARLYDDADPAVIKPE